ncbi:MAG: sensor histidine kinase, partial [Chloroflexi bacterium]|nr:sensor histidine kinase [Chloroflexota bacterium]
RARIVQAQAEERRRTERDIHDGAQQELVGLIAKLRLARNQLRADVEEADAALVELQHDAQTALNGLRELAQGIHPSVLTDRGLVAAIDARADRCPIPVAVRVDSGLRSARFADETEGAAYFAVSEALTNALKHSAASRIDVTVTLAGDRLRIAVTDDGIGFAPHASGGTGLVGLADRVEAAGGRLSVDGASGRGTSVVIELGATPRPLSHA